jgi:hypothetical protein
VVAPGISPSVTNAYWPDKPDGYTLIAFPPARAVVISGDKMKKPFMVICAGAMLACWQAVRQTL